MVISIVEEMSEKKPFFWSSFDGFLHTTPSSK